MFQSKNALIILCIACLGGTCIGQEDRGEVISIIDQMFDGMRAGDSTEIRDLFMKGTSLSSISTSNDGETVKRTMPVSTFITMVGTPHDKIWDERIWSYDVKIDGPMAYVWTDYSLYVGDVLVHCGVNMFELMQIGEGWKISGITDTRRKENCITDPVSDIHAMLDSWHRAAANGDEDVFFESISENGIYIGTDPSERWEREEMRTWSKEYFDRDSAWSFTPLERNVNLSTDGRLAWFDELLDTWMGTCRASGILIKEGGKWKIEHYHLSIAVPNNKVDGYLELIEKPR